MPPAHSRPRSIFLAAISPKNNKYNFVNNAGLF